MPKRSDKRRTVYLGENIECSLKIHTAQLRGRVIDLSPRGMALVEAIPNGKLKLQSYLGKSVTLTFKKPNKETYNIEAELGNLSHTKLGQGTLERLGIKFKVETFQTQKSFTDALPPQYYPCQNEIRPQAYCQDPFFFNETILFQVNGVTPKGVDLLVSARCKTILPQQPHVLTICIPGRGLFRVHVKTSRFFLYLNNHYRIFMEYQNPVSQAYLEAISEYLINFSKEVTPKDLREHGFVLGDLTMAFSMDHSKVSQDILLKHNLHPTVLGAPVEAVKESLMLPPHARSVSCKLGPNLVATFGLFFVEKAHPQSRFESLGHKIRRDVLGDRFLELADFYLSPQVSLVDVLIQIIRHAVRIAVQSEAQVLLLEGTSDILPVLKRIGFKPHGSERLSSVKGAQTVFLLELHPKDIVKNATSRISEKVWIKIYRDLHEYLKAHESI